MLERFRHLWTPGDREGDLQASLAALRRRTPVPVFWLLGKTQSGKTSLIKFLTGADAAEIGEGFRPCTRSSRLYHFPTSETPVLTFLDTRGLDEPDYDPAEDIARFGHQAHLVIVTAKVLDHALANLLATLRKVYQDRPSRPILLVLTCLHEAYPQQQHPQPYPFDAGLDGPNVQPDLARSLAEQRERFAGLVRATVPIDLTRPEDGYEDPTYGGERFKHVLLELLPAAYRQTLLTVELATNELRDIHLRHALPVITGYTALAATVGAMPIPFLDLVILPGVQSRMIHHLARQYGQPLSGKHFLEIASTLGIGMMARQAVRELSKLMPVIGSVAGAALAGASTFALGRAFCYYYGAIHEGHLPDAQSLRKYYEDQLRVAEQAWRATVEPRRRESRNPQPGESL